MANIEYASGVENVLTFDPEVMGSEDWREITVQSAESGAHLIDLVVPQSAAQLNGPQARELIAALQGALDALGI